MEKTQTPPRCCHGPAHPGPWYSVRFPQPTGCPISVEETLCFGCRNALLLKVAEGTRRSIRVSLLKEV